MIEIKNATINNTSNTLINKIDVSFDNGLNILPVDKKAIFNFLSFKSVVLNSGEFIINGTKIVPLQNRELCLFLLGIGSQNINIDACFESHFLEKQDFFKSIVDDLNKLKDLPLESDEQKKEKLQKIFDVLKAKKALYILLDNNEKTNVDSKILIEEVIKNNEKDLTIIALEYNPLEVAAQKKRERENSTLVSFEQMPTSKMNDAEIKKHEIEHEKQLAKEAKIRAKLERKELKAEQVKAHKDEVKLREKETAIKLRKMKESGEFSMTDILAETYKKNWLVFLLQILTVAFSVFLFAMIPYLFAEDKTIPAIIIAVNAVIALFVGIFIIVSSFDFLDKPDILTKKRFHVILTASFISVAMGIIAGLAVLLLLGRYEVLLTLEKYKAVYSVLGISAAVIFVFVLALVKQIRKVMSKFKKLSKNKNKNTKDK